MHVRKAAAVVKGIACDARHTIRDCDARKAAAAVKGLFTNACHTFRDHQIGHKFSIEIQIMGAKERIRIRSIKCNATPRRYVRNIHARKAAAAEKGIVSDAHHAVWDRDACEAAAAGKGIVSDACYAAVRRYHAVFTAADKRLAGRLDEAVPGGVIDGVPICNSDRFQRGAAIEGFATDARHALRDRDARKTAAAGKDIVTNARHTVRNHQIGHKFTIEIQTVGVVEWIRIKRSKCNVTPRRHVRNMHVRKAAAVDKGIACDARHAIRDRDARKTAAAVKGPVSDARHAIRDGDARKTGAIFKGIACDARHAVRDGDVRKAAAVVKGIVPNARHAVRNCDAHEVSAVIKSIRSDACHAVRDGDACKTAATVKGIACDARYAVWDRDACEAAAAGKGIACDARHAVRDGDVRKAAAVGKGTSSDARHTEFDNNRLYLRTIFIPRRSDTLVICHHPCAFDGEITIKGQRPCKPIAARAGVDRRRWRRVTVMLDSILKRLIIAAEIDLCPVVR